MAEESRFSSKTSKRFLSGYTEAEYRDNDTGNSGHGSSSKSDPDEAKQEAVGNAQDDLRDKQGPYPSETRKP